MELVEGVLGAKAKQVRKRGFLRYLRRLDQDRLVRSGRTRLGRKVWALVGSFGPRT